MQYYNFRDKFGRFAKRTPQTIVAGRLYGYRGSIVRAGQKCNNGKRHVSFHKQIHGFVDEAELQLIDRNEVQSYLQNAAPAKQG